MLWKIGDGSTPPLVEGGRTRLSAQTVYLRKKSLITDTTRWICASVSSG